MVESTVRLNRDRLERLLRLVALLQSRQAVPGKKLCKELGISGRTLDREVRALRDFGIDVDCYSQGYRLW